MTNPPPTTTAESPGSVYRRLWGRYEGEASALRRRSSVMAPGRLATFFGTLICLAVAVIGTEHPRVPWLVAAGLLLAAFAVLVALDGRLARRLRRLEALRDVNDRALARLERAFDRLPPCPEAAELLAPAAGGADGEGAADRAGEPAPFVRDLHLFGRSSLFRLVSTARTPSGRRRLARWLADPAPAVEIARRQEAVRALASALAARQEIEAAGIGVSSAVPDLERFYRWAEGESWLNRHRWRLWVARLLTVLIVPCFVAVGAGLVPWDLPVALAIAGYLLSAASAEDLHAIFDHATAGGDGLRGYGPVLRAVERLLGREGPGGVNATGGDRENEGSASVPEQAAAAEPRPALLDELAARLSPAGRPVAAWMDRLEGLTVLSDVRRGLIYFFVQVLTLWDFHVAARFEAWQREVGGSVRDWLEALGELEALASLAALAHAHPEWAWPRVGGGGAAGHQAQPVDTFRALDLGHPLIPSDRRVGNDVEVGPPGTFLLVTGSNMSGKTTLIRAIGVNAVLAEAGGPVCARELTMPPVRLATSIVVEDSLEDGVSFFMAELLRLKGVVDAAAAEAAEDEAGRRLLYLLDEVLRGTNSAERRVAIQRVLRRLLDLGAIGAITTHDLQILAEGELERSAVPIHFRETILPRPEGGADMRFDFIARPGLAPTTNALRLLEAVGLGEWETDG